MKREELLIKAKPILFNSEKVNAILKNESTVHRRLMKRQPDIHFEGTQYECKHVEGFFDAGDNNWACRKSGCGITANWKSVYRCPYVVGDILYVKETWNYVSEFDEDDQMIDDSERYVYYADDKMPFTHWVKEDGTHSDKMSWKSSVHMPKEATRLFLKVTGVRIEKLQEITIDDAYKEGVGDPFDYYEPEYWDQKQFVDVDSKICAFAGFWNSQIKKRDLGKFGWDANPYVWVIDFKRIEEN